MNRKYTDQTYNYWEQMGYEIGAIGINCYTKVIADYCAKDNISHVSLVARDGYTLEKVLNLVKKTNFTTKYIYTPRYMSLFLKDDISNLDEMGMWDLVQTLSL